MSDEVYPDPYKVRHIPPPPPNLDDLNEEEKTLLTQYNELFKRTDISDEDLLLEVHKVIRNVVVPHKNRRFKELVIKSPDFEALIHRLGHLLGL